MSANTSIEVPVNETTTLFLSARRSYTDVLATSLFEDIFSIYEDINFEDTPAEISIEQFDVDPEFYYSDLVFKLSTWLGVKNRLSFSYYDSNDIMSYDEYLSGKLPGDTTIVYSNVGNLNWGNVGTSLKFSRLWNTQHFTNILLSYSYYRSEFEERNTTMISGDQFDNTFIADIDQSNFIKDFSLKVDHEWMLGLNRLELGASMSLYHTQINSLQNDSIITFRNQPGSAVFTQYIQDKLSLTSNSELSLGLRGNYVSNTGEYHFEPRASLSHRFNKSITGSVSTGIYRQFVNQVNTENALQGSRDLWLMSDEDIPSQRSWHLMGGLNRTYQNSTITLSGFYKTFDGLLDYAFSLGDLNTEYQNYQQQFFQGNGLSRGVELLVKQSTGGFTGWVSYTYSQTDYKFDQLNSGDFFPADHDQTHELNLFGSYKLGRFTFYSTWYYGSGLPYSNFDVPPDRKQKRQANKQVVVFDRDRKNNLRFPAYHRLDFGVNYSMPVSTNVFRISGKIFNVYNRRNVIDRKIEMINATGPLQMPDNMPKTDDMSKLKPIEKVVDIQLMGFTPTIMLEFSF